MIVTKKTWSLGKRLFRGSFKKRMRFFEALVESVVSYGAEV